MATSLIRNKVRTTFLSEREDRIENRCPFQLPHSLNREGRDPVCGYPKVFTRRWILCSYGVTEAAVPRMCPMRRHPLGMVVTLIEETVEGD